MGRIHYEYAGSEKGFGTILGTCPYNHRFNVQWFFDAGQWRGHAIRYAGTDDFCWNDVGLDILELDLPEFFSFCFFSVNTIWLSS